MEKFSRLYHVNDMLYSTGWPVVVCALALLKDNETNKLIGQIKFRSISDKRIKALSVKLIIKDSANRKKGKEVLYQYLDLKLDRNREFGSNVPIAIDDKEARSFEVLIDEVVFEDNSVYKNTSKKTRDIEQFVELNEVFNLKEIVYFRENYNMQAMYIPKEFDELWYCTCGSINNKTEKCCPFCEFNKTVISKLDFDKIKIASEYNDALKKLDSKVFSEVLLAKEMFLKLKNYEDSKKLVNTCEEFIVKHKENSLKTKNMIIKFSKYFGVFLVLVAIVYSVIFFIIPSFKYENAKNLVEDKEYVKALDALDEMPYSYKDVRELKETCYLEYGDILLGDNKFIEAIKYYDELRDDELRVEVLNNANYEYALYLTDEESYEDAYDLFAAIDFYEDSADKMIEVSNLNATKYFEEEKYLDAITWYKKSENVDGLNDSKYQYIKNNYNVEDVSTYEFLVGLIKEDYEDSLDLYNDLYEISAVIRINGSSEDDGSSPSTIKQSSVNSLLAHYKIDALVPSGELNVKMVYETKWGTGGQVKTDWEEQDRYFSSEAINKEVNVWNKGYLNKASNLYYHRVTIYNNDTGEKIATSKSVYTPFDY